MIDSKRPAPVPVTRRQAASSCSPACYPRTGPCRGLARRLSRAWRLKSWRFRADERRMGFKDEPPLPAPRMSRHEPARRARRGQRRRPYPLGRRPVRPPSHAAAAILQRIEEINRTTQVISMNTRIESARIGTAGRGFAAIAQGDGRPPRGAWPTPPATSTAPPNPPPAKCTTPSPGWKTTYAHPGSDELALVNIDPIDRNLYERSCDVRWWATDTAVVAAAQPDCTSDALPTPRGPDGADPRIRTRSTSTWYWSAPTSRVLANGRPQEYPSAGLDVRDTRVVRPPPAWRTASGEAVRLPDCACQPVGRLASACWSTLCSVREAAASMGEVLGVLGIVFRWDALAQTVSAAHAVVGAGMGTQPGVHRR